MDTYNPRGEQFKDVYLIEKISTKEGWTPPAPDENFTMGYQAEMQDFVDLRRRGHAAAVGPRAGAGHDRRHLRRLPVGRARRAARSRSRGSEVGTARRPPQNTPNARIEKTVDAAR